MLRGRRATPATAHWSKDFVEHLRAVHFTLVAVSVGLILILSRTNSPALSEIRQINELRRDWPPEDLANDVESVDNPLVRSISHVPVKWKGKADWKVRFTTASGKETVAHLTYEGPYWVPASPTSNLFSVTAFPRTLKEFRSWWAALVVPHPYCYPTWMEKKGTLYVLGAEWDVPFSVVQSDYWENGAEPPTDTLKFQPKRYSYGTPPNNEDKGIRPFIVFEAHDQHMEQIFTIESADVQEQSLDQDAIVTLVNKKGWGWVKGPFERSFSALAQEAKGLEAEDLDEIEKVMAERLANRSEEFDAFGMKFPIPQVTVWGTIILLSIQLYFFLYLRQLSGKLSSDDPAWDIPWICMDQSFLAQSIFFSTVVLLPSSAMLLLGVRASQRLMAGLRTPTLTDWLRNLGWNVTLQIALYFLASATLVVLGILSWRCRPRLNKTPEWHCSGQLFE